MNLSRALSGQLTAVKTLKVIFREFFKTLTDPKLLFVNCKSVSVMRGPPFFLIQPKLICLVTLFSNYSLYDFNTTRFQSLKKVSIFSYDWSLLKLYYIILILISPSGLEKLFNESWLKFSEKSLWFKWLRHFLVALFY